MLYHVRLFPIFLSDTLECVLNSGFNRFGFDAPDSLHKALADCRDCYGYYNSGAIFLLRLICARRGYLLTA